VLAESKVNLALIKKKQPHIIFYVPYYHDHSNGIKILWEIAYRFSRLNKNTHVLEASWGPKKRRPEKYDGLVIDRSSLNFIDDPIVIYPDVLHDNPLKVKRNVKYLLAKPYSFGNEFIPCATDYVATYSQMVLDKKQLDQFYFLNNEPEFFKNIDIKRKKNLVTIYYGKCRFSDSNKYLLDIINQFEFVEIITRSIPDNQEDLHRILSQSKLLISFDAFTHISLIANIYGTPVLFTDDIFSEVFRNFNHKIYGYYYKNDIGNLKKIISVNNMQKISQSTVNEIKRIKLSEKKELLRFYNAIIRHFKNISNLAYHKKNLNKLEIANTHFIQFNKDYWKKKDLFVVMGTREFFAFHLLKYKYLFILLTNLNKFKRFMIRTAKKIASIFAFQNKLKGAQDIFSIDTALNTSIQSIKSSHSSDIISKQRTKKNKRILSFLYRL
jgi:hypothetical protein